MTDNNKGDAQSELPDFTQVKQHKITPPSLRQMLVLRAIDQYVTDNDGASLTFRELAELVGARSVRTVTEHVQTLRRKHLIENIPGEARTLFLTKEGRRQLKAYKFPEHAKHVRVG